MKVHARAQVFLDEAAHEATQTVLDREFATTREAGHAVAAVADAAAARLAFAYTGDQKRACALVRHAGGALETGANVLWRAGEWRIDVFLTRSRPLDDSAIAAGSDRVAWRLAETVAVIRVTIATD